MDTFSIEAEILGALLTDSENAGEIFQRLTAADFSSALWQNIFSAAHSLFREGKTINTVTVCYDLSAMYEDGQAQTLEQALNGLIARPAPNVKEYISMLLDSRALERLREKGVALSVAANLDEAREITREALVVGASKAKAEVKTSLQAALDFADYMEAYAEKTPVYLDWGITPLTKDICTELGDFVIIGGRPSVGKTLFALQAATALAKTWRVGFVSLETPVEKLTRRAMAYLSGVPLWKLKNPELLTLDDHRALLPAKESFAQLNLEMICSARTVDQIEAAAINRRWDVVIIDYIQIVRGKGSSRYEVVTNISQELHTMAQTHGITVIGLAQLSRGSKSTSGEEKPPTLESLRESGQLEQDADTVMLMYLENPDDKRSNRYLKVAKNKEGECGLMKLEFKGETQTFLVSKEDW